MRPSKPNLRLWRTPLVDDVRCTPTDDISSTYLARGEQAMHYGKRFGRSPSVQGRVGRRDCPCAHRRPERVAVARDVARVDPYPVL